MHAEKKLVLENHCIMEKFNNILVENITAQILFNILYIRPVESSDGDAILLLDLNQAFDTIDLDCLNFDNRLLHVDITTSHKNVCNCRS